MKTVFNRIFPYLLVGLFVYQLASVGLPISFPDGVIPIVGPKSGPRLVVTITESGEATPKRDGLLAQLQNDTDWGKSQYFAYEANHAQAKPYPGKGLHIYELKEPGKRGETPLFTGPLPETKEQVLQAWRDTHGE